MLQSRLKKCKKCRNPANVLAVGKLVLRFLCYVAFVFCLFAQAAQESLTAGELFDKPTLVRLHIHLPVAELSKLRENPRVMVPARVVIDDKDFPNTAVRLKGGQGSFRPVTEKPGWTLDFNRFNKGQALYGISKIHVNNSVQDSTYLCEDLSAGLFRRAGVPAPRIAWATVTLNDRQLGLYVLKEGITKEWLRLQFGDGTGNLYDSGTHQEINQPLRLDSGEGAEDRADLRALAEAAGIGNPEQRWAALQQALDLEQFINFVACEVLANHTDGYSLMQNNYRIYFSPKTHQATFLPQGMDRMFWEPRATLQPKMKALLAVAVMSVPEGESRYRARLKQLAEQTFDPGWITNRMGDVLAAIGPVEPLAARDAEPLKARVLERIEYVRKTTAAW